MTAIHLVLFVIVPIIVNCNGFKLPKETKDNLIPSDLLSDSNTGIDGDHFCIEDNSFVSASKSLSKESELDGEYGFDPKSIVEFLKRVKRALDSDVTEIDQSNSTRRTVSNRSKESSNQSARNSANQSTSKRDGKSEKSGSSKSNSNSSSGKNRQNSKSQKSNSNGSSKKSEKHKSKESGKSEKENSNLKSSNSKNQSKESETGRGDDQEKETNTDDKADLFGISKLHDLLAIPRLVKDLVHRVIKLIENDDDSFDLFTGPDVILNRFKDIFKALRL